MLSGTLMCQETAKSPWRIRRRDYVKRLIAAKRLALSINMQQLETSVATKTGSAPCREKSTGNGEETVECILNRQQL